MELYQLSVTIIFALSHNDVFAIWQARLSSSAVTTNRTEHENDNILMTTKWILTELWQNTQVSDIRPSWVSCYHFYVILNYFVKLFGFMVANYVLRLRERVAVKRKFQP